MAAPNLTPDPYDAAEAEYRLRALYAANCRIAFHHARRVLGAACGPPVNDRALLLAMEAVRLGYAAMAAADAAAEVACGALSSGGGVDLWVTVRPERRQ